MSTEGSTNLNVSSVVFTAQVTRFMFIDGQDMCFDRDRAKALEQLIVWL